MPAFVRTAERHLRFLFYVATCLMLTVAVTRAPPVLAVIIALIVGSLAMLGWANVPPLFRKGDATKPLRAELLSVGAAVALLVLSFILRSTTRPFGAVDVVAIVALAYFGWRVRVVRRHLREGTLPTALRRPLPDVSAALRTVIGGSGSTPSRRDAERRDDR